MDKRKSFLKNSGFVEKIGLMVALFIIVVVFTVINKNYFSTQNLLNILTSASLTGLVAIGETYLIIAGLIDLSPGSIAAFSSVVAGLLLTMGVPSMLILPLVVLIGLLIGFLNGMGVNKLKLEPFIVTLSAMSIFRGLGYILCGGKPVFISDKSFTDIGSRQVLGIFNLPVLVLILAFLVSAIVLSKTFFGRSVYVLGGNKYAARLAGLNPEKISTILFMISAGLSALGGGLLAAITASVLGGVAMSGGVGSVGGMILGVLILQCFNTGLIMAQVQVYWQTVARGLLLLIALAFDFYRRNKHQKKMLMQSIEAGRSGAN